MEDLRKRTEAQIQEILGDDNMWYAGERLGHSPNPNEAAMHFVNHGGAADFAQRWAESHRGVA